ncbi:Peptidoglycan-binding domain 1 protein [Parvibaculum lavamentivorans DS-1]|uniref:Peptidoglycan-binding domain 1 protein n=1 Tax=Parvibaculum lavamentivorans (strain DS-1 / DSM 13023 / NCIMB 13966) TaxID=402881 RepID=A7HX77_PARL1|nr:L,D-transpeptidase family protein [Parvibaculum lavamentivorans]ABS64510.1 Peptidoglycan-binding domain 1 protein [Parvibaculum lavamentivorans DS-1]
MAEIARNYGQDQTHWVDPWQAETGAAVAEAPPFERSSAPVLSAETLLPLTHAIETYRVIANLGGWGYVASGERLELGVRDPRVVQVRERLTATGDLTVPAQDAELYDANVYEAVRRYQVRNGLEPDGIVGRRTIAAMNVRVQTRIRQLELNLRRLSAAVPALPDRYVFVNIAGQEVEAVNNGIVEFREPVIVGKQDRQTPEITSEVNSITFNPYWYVPKSIAMADMLPKIRANPDYLQRQGIRVLQGWDTNIRELNPRNIDWSNPRINEAYYFRQDPGPGNSLGSLKINFPNNQAIFLHDTPTKTLFGRQERNFSSGCVRVQNVRGLVSWLMQGDSSEWDAARVARSVDSRQYRNVSLATPVPIYLMYLTAWVTPEGIVNFRDDVYDRDGSVNTSALEN